MIDILIQQCLIQRCHCHTRYFSDIILVFFPISFVTIYFVFCHWLITITNACIRSFQTSTSLIITRSFSNIDSWYFCRDKKLPSFSMTVNNGLTTGCICRHCSLIFFGYPAHHKLRFLYNPFFHQYQRLSFRHHPDSRNSTTYHIIS